MTARFVGESRIRTRTALDLPGAVLVSGALFCLTFALVRRPPRVRTAARWRRSSRRVAGARRGLPRARGDHRRADACCTLPPRGVPRTANSTSRSPTRRSRRRCSSSRSTSRTCAAGARCRPEAVAHDERAVPRGRRARRLAAGALSVRRVSVAGSRRAVPASRCSLLGTDCRTCRPSRLRALRRGLRCRGAGDPAVAMVPRGAPRRRRVGVPERGPSGRRAAVVDCRR